MSVDRDRRHFLKFLGAGLSGLSFGTSPLGPLAQSPGPMPFQQDPSTAGPARLPSGAFLTFTPIQPSTRDELVLPPGFAYDVVAAWGDRLPGTNARFGYNADFTAFIPTGGGSEGVLFVNHEYISLPTESGAIGVYDQTFPRVIGGEPRLDDYMLDVGASVLHLRHDARSAGRSSRLR